MSREEPEFSFVYVKLRLNTMTKYTEKVYIDLQSHVSVLRHKICEKDTTLNKDNFIMVYCGNIMEDPVPIYNYNLFNGATVHLFKKVNNEKIQPLDSIDKSHAGLVKLGQALRSFPLNISYKSALMDIDKNTLINELILKIPQLNEDPVAVTLLQHSEFLIKLNDVNLLKDIAEKHPALALAVLKMSSIVNKVVVQNHVDVLTRSISTGSNEEIGDLDNSSSESDTNSQPMNRIHAITAADLARAIEIVTTHHPQPSTSGASTSTGNTGNVLMTQPTTPAVDYSHQLGIMREMGLCNESLNLQGLRLGGGHLETAIELVLNGLNTLE